MSARVGGRGAVVAIALFALLLIAYLVSSHYLSTQTSDVVVPDEFLALAPLEHVGPRSDSYLADGVRDQVARRLRSVERLGFVTRGATYWERAGAESSRADIAFDLGVDYLLDMKIEVLRGKSDATRVRLTPRLLDADSLTVSTLEVEYPVRELFALTDSVTSWLARQMGFLYERGARPMEGGHESGELGEGRALLDGVDDEKSLREAVEILARVAASDSGSVKAQTALAQGFIELYEYGFDRSNACAEAARTASERALAIDPARIDGQVALAAYYRVCRRDYKRALSSFAAEDARGVRDGFVATSLGYSTRWQQRWVDALAAFTLALELDPASPRRALDLATTYLYLRCYPEAEVYFERALGTKPDLIEAYLDRARLCVLRDGDTAAAREVLHEAEPYVGSAVLLYTHVWLDCVDESYSAALARIRSYEGSVIEDAFHFVPAAMVKAWIYERLERGDDAARQYEAAWAVLSNVRETMGEDPRYLSAAGIVQAALGRRHEALRDGRGAVRRTMRQDYARRADLARLYMMAGGTGAAINELVTLILAPSDMSVTLMGIDPLWDPLRNDVRFQSLLDDEAAGAYSD